MPKKAEKLLDQIRRAPHSATRADLEQLYLSFGFVIEHGAKHDKITHKQYRQLRTMLPRHRELASAYFLEAVKLIDKLKALEDTTS